MLIVSYKLKFNPESEKKKIMSVSIGMSKLKFLRKLQNYLKANDVKNAIKLIKNKKNSANLKKLCVHCIKLTLHYLTDDNYDNNSALFTGCGEILNHISTKCNPEKCIYQYLKVIEIRKNATNFISILTALQISILQQKTNNTGRTLIRCLNSIQKFITQLPLFSKNIKNYLYNNDKKLWENHKEVLAVTTLNMTLVLFYEPILNKILEFQEIEINSHQQLSPPSPQSPTAHVYFKNIISTTNQRSRHMLAGFILQLFDCPFAYLNFTSLTNDIVDDSETTTNISNITPVYCAKRLIKNISQLFTDPFKLLFYVVRKILEPIQIIKSMAEENRSANIYAITEKIPLTAVGIYLYLLISENMMPETAPKIYTTLYIYEKCLYIVTALFKTKDELIIQKGLRLGSKTIRNLSPMDILTINDLDLCVHSEFRKHLFVVLKHSHKCNAINSANLFVNYVLRFENDARYMLIYHLFRVIKNDRIDGILIKIYNDILHELLMLNENRRMPHWFSGPKFKFVFLNVICKLENGYENYIFDHSNRIISALKLIIYLTQRDLHNQCSYWDCVDTIQENFLNPLQTVVVNYKMEYSDCNRVNELSFPTTKVKLFMHKFYLDILNTLCKLIEKAKYYINRNYPIYCRIMNK